MPRFTIKLEKAHDVRLLRTCGHCQQIGDDRYMPNVGGVPLHGICAFEKLGADGLAALDQTEYGKVTIGEIGPKAMIEVMEAIDRQETLKSKK